MNRNYPGKEGVGGVEKQKSKPGIVNRTSNGPLSINVIVYPRN